MKRKYDLIVIGGGILGTFHAYAAIKKGLKVALFEKDSQPSGATVRNFGQIVPSGMNTKWQNYGRKSVEIYKSIQSKFDISVRQQGSVYLASNKEEEQLLEELSVINQKNNYDSILLTKLDCLQKYPGLQKDYVTMGLFFPEEITVEPRELIHSVLNYLVHLGLDYKLNSQIIGCEAVANNVDVITSNHQVFEASKVIICSGSDFKTLYPTIFNKSDIIACKLQMMQTMPQKNYQLNGSILTGWSIRRYEAFQECASYADIKKKEAQDSFQKKWGVHVLFKQAVDGSIIIGDSHEYKPVSKMDELGFDLNTEIDEFIISEAKKIFKLPNYTIRNRWFGIYSQCEKADIFNKKIAKNIHVVTGIGGKGMTASAGYAKENIDKIFNF